MTIHHQIVHLQFSDDEPENVRVTLDGIASAPTDEMRAVLLRLDPRFDLHEAQRLRCRLIEIERDRLAAREKTRRKLFLALASACLVLLFVTDFYLITPK